MKKTNYNIYKKLKKKGVSVEIFEGEFIVILGTSGGGKTTLLNIMGTIDKPTKVYIYLKKYIYIYVYLLYIKYKGDIIICG